MRSLLVISLVLFSAFASSQSIPPIGEWREHLPYHSTTDLAQGEGKIFAATPFSVFSVDPATGEIERMSRMTGLSETGISAIEYDPLDQRLLIAYSNSNLDIIEQGKIYNVPGVKLSSVPGNKTIYNIFSPGRFFYLATGLGVIVIDGDRREVRETWYLESSGQLRVNDITAGAGYYYAATEAGMMRMPVNAPNPTDPQSWSSTDYNLGGGDFSFVVSLQDRIYAERNDSIFRLDGATWNLFYTSGFTILNLQETESKLAVSERNAAGQGRVTLLSGDGSLYRVLSNTGAVSLPAKVMVVNDQPWIADRFAGLSQVFASGAYENYRLNSPLSIASGEMKFANGMVYVAAGAVNDSWNYQFNSDGIYLFGNGEWKNVHRQEFPVLDSLLDFVTIEPDHRDDSYWAGSFGGGLLHATSRDEFRIYKQGYLGETVGDPGSYRVGGLALDQDRNLWISNFGSSEPLRVMKSDGVWKSFTVPFFLFQRALSQIIIDRNNYKWIVSPLGNGVVLFDHGKDIEDLTDDRWRRLGAGSGNGNLPSSEVWSLAKDKDDLIWVGTSDGIGVFECVENIFNSCDAVWPVVPNGSFSGYLFKGQQVRSIAVDGANRKWVATPNGVFLVSPTGENVIYQFTENNSPLLSSDVRQVAINGETGEVFFATMKGICSFRSTATEGGEKNEDRIIIFPNPVPPGYSGTIGFRGLVNNAIVKITELDGRLVYQTRAFGGQATWDGRNYRGQRISSGVYLVLVADDNGKENASGRVVFLR